MNNEDRSIKIFKNSLLIQALLHLREKRRSIRVSEMIPRQDAFIVEDDELMPWDDYRQACNNSTYHNENP